MFIKFICSFIIVDSIILSCSIELDYLLHVLISYLFKLFLKMNKIEIKGN